MDIADMLSPDALTLVQRTMPHFLADPDDATGEERGLKRKTSLRNPHRSSGRVSLQTPLGGSPVFYLGIGIKSQHYAVSVDPDVTPQVSE